MRRLLLAAAIAAPTIALGAQSASSGQVIEVDNFNVTAGTSYVNAAACATGGTASLEWFVVVVSGTFIASGTYQILSSNTAPVTTGTNAGFCPADAPTANPVVNTAQVDSVAVATSIQDKAVSGSAIASAAKLTCDQSSEGRVLYVCVQQVDSSGTKVARASGKFVIQVLAPDAPAITSIGAGDGELIVSFSAPAAGAAVDHYAAVATPSGSTTGQQYWSSTTTGSPVTISGLANNTTYDVVVYAYSVGGNPSPASAPQTATPLPSADFWQVYKNRGGQEAGGCGSGAAGAPALLGALALLALRRRVR